MGAASGGDDLVGREREQSQLSGLITRLPTAGGALALPGEGGTGKSALLSWLVDRARSRGVQVLTAAMGEDDFATPYAGLRRLFPEVPWSGSAALAALDVVVDRSPVVVVVDDAHWLDPASWTALTFVARRLSHHRAALVLALRENTATTARLRSSGLPALAVEPLDPAAARLLLDRHAAGLRPAQSARVLSLAEGNPLALVELAATARTARPGLAADPPLTPRLELTFAPSLEALPATVRTLLHVAALADGPSADEVIGAARRLDPRIRPGDLTAAETARLITVVEPFEVRFRHPLTRSVIRHAMGPDRRREVHQALAGGLAAHPDRRLWHQAGAAAGPDGPLADRLAEAAGEAAGRGAMTAAARLYERAAQLSPDSRQWADRLLWAAATTQDAGDPDTAAHLLDALPDHHLTAGQEVRLAQLRDDGAYPQRFLDATAPVSPGLGLHAIEFFLAGPGQVAPVGCDGSPGVAEPAALCVLALADPVGRGAEVLPPIRRHARELTGPPGDLVLVALAGLGAGSMPESFRLAAAATARLRGQDADGLLARALTVQALAATQLGNALLAGECAAEAGRVGTETGQPRWRRIADLARARAAALRGDADEALGLVAAVPRWPAAARLVRGEVAAAGGRPDVAFDELASLFDPAASTFHRTLRFWALSTFAEAAVDCGRSRQLRDLLAGLDRAGLPVLDVALVHADAVLADTDEAYAAALTHAVLPEWPFELARLQLAHGSRLRRQRRTADARPLLRAAAHTFTVLGAHPWAARAEAGLRAAGERAGVDGDPRQLLTPQELQIALLVADGLSSRQIAARLVLTPRSVDSHLYRVYRKAGVSSRAELAKLMLTTR